MTPTDKTPLGETEVHDLWSDAVGDTFRVFVGPCGEKPQSTLYLTDANGLFGLTVDTVRLMQIPALVPPMLVVGVGYPDATVLGDTVEVRARDLTPTPHPMFHRSGGADAFIGFIRDELGPWLQSRHPDAVGDSTYFGHSLGGLFGAYALLTETELFTRYILSSPSLWWDSERIFELQPKPSAVAGRDDPIVVVGIGSLETDAGRRLEGANLPVGHPAKPPPSHLDMVDDARRFVAHLARMDTRVDVRGIEIADEFHATVPAVVLSRALRYFHS